MGRKFWPKMYRAKSARSGYSDESRDHEADSLELELQKLQQRFRVSEGERKNLYISREQTKNNQKDLLKSLLAEKENLEKNLNLASSKINQTRDNEYSESIRNGTSKIEQLKKKIQKISESSQPLCVIRYGLRFFKPTQAISLAR